MHVLSTCIKCGPLSASSAMVDPGGGTKVTSSEEPPRSSAPIVFSGTAPAGSMCGGSSNDDQLMRTRSWPLFLP